MFIATIVSQDLQPTDFLWALVPVVCCAIVMGVSRGGDGNQKGETLRESWFTTQDITTAYNSIEEKTGEWRKEVGINKKSNVSSFLKQVLGGGKEVERFTVNITSPPRLYKLNDKSGPIYFELTEVVGGGTIINATYSSLVKSYIAEFKAAQPLKIPANPIGNHCAVCGKPVLPEFNVCPYCGEKIVKEPQ